MNKPISRRDFLKLAGGAAVTVAGVGFLPQFLRKTLSPVSVAGATEPYDLFFGGTDGWFWLPDDSPNVGDLAPFFPDTLAPENTNTYIFGFRNLTHLNDTQRQNQRNKAQHNAPFFWVDQETEFRMRLTNLGLALRPDLTDSHTLHWHGFRNVIPFYDGEPTGSVSVPVGQIFTYVYKPHDPGCYMYHCHVEDIEHVTMGMTGIVFVRAAHNKVPGKLDLGLNRSAPSKPYLGFAYNDDSTGYDREFTMFLSEIWSEGHWNDAHIQESDWSTFKADFSLLNGRVYPQTLLPNSPIDKPNSIWGSGSALTIQTDPDTGDLLPPVGHPELQYNPHSALVSCEAGESVLLRFANLGFREAAMTLAGINLRVVGRDATPMRGVSGYDANGNPIRQGDDTSYLTNTLLFGAGESFDAIFTAPAFSGGTGSSGQGYDVYTLYNRRYTQEDSSHGQRTEVRVYPTGALGPQEYLNQHPDDLAA